MSRTLGDLLRAAADRAGDAPAYHFHQGTGEPAVLSYAGLLARATEVAALVGRRAAPGARAVLALAPGPDFLAGFLGCQLAGLAAVPVYPPAVGRPEAGLATMARIVDDCRAEVVLTGPDTGHVACAGRAGWPGRPGVEWLDTADAGPAPGWSAPVVRPDTVALLQYTSGSTSLPKGVVLRHEHLLANLRSMDWFVGRPAHGVVVSWLPVYHDMGLIGTVLYPLFRGFPGHLMPPLQFLARPLRWLELISRTGATISGGPSFAYQLCTLRADQVEPGTLDLSGWEVAFNGAEPINPAVLTAFETAFAPSGLRPGTVVGCYGMAEASLLITGARRGDPGRVLRVRRDDMAAGLATTLTDADGARGRRRPPDAGVEVVSSGSAPPGHDVRIVAPDTPGGPVELPDGWIGEIWFRGPSVGAGYWGDRERSVATFDAELDGRRGYLRTGDLGFRLEGRFHVTGRACDLLIVRGRNVHPHDVEATVQAADPRLRIGGGVAVATDSGTGIRLIQEVACTGPEPLRELARTARTAVLTGLGVALDTVELVAPRSVRKTTSGKPRRRATLAALEAGELDVRYRDTAPDAETGPDRDSAEPGNPAERDEVGIDEQQRC